MIAFKQEYPNEYDNGITCIWTYSSGDSSECCDEVEEENTMWNHASIVSFNPEAEKEQDEVKNTPVKEETHNNPKRRLVSYYSERDIRVSVDSAVSSALERARRRHSLNKERGDSREFRRSFYVGISLKSQMA